MKKNVKRFVCIMCIMALSTAVCYGAEWVHSEAPYDGYQTDTIVLTGEGLNKEVSFTVAELEAMTEQAVTAMYTLSLIHIFRPIPVPATRGAVGHDGGPGRGCGASVQD